MPPEPPKLDLLLLNGAETLEVEIRAERASALERAGLRAEKAIEAYRRAPEDERRALLRTTADALYAYVIQRELMGFRAHGEVYERLSAPREVIAALGAR